MWLSCSQVKCYMKQLLSGLEHCHTNGVLHRDIKGSNLLLDNSGTLKIADFGLATFYRPEQNVPLTSRVVTLWYRPPELLLGATNYGVAVDLWSAGCILAELLAGKPIMPGRTEVGGLPPMWARLPAAYSSWEFSGPMCPVLFAEACRSLLPSCLWWCAGGATPQDLQAVRVSFGGLLAKVEAPSRHHLQTLAAVQAQPQGHLQGLSRYVPGAA